jgi:hypothetical protein
MKWLHYWSSVCTNKLKRRLHYHLRYIVECTLYHITQGVVDPSFKCKYVWKFLLQTPLNSPITTATGCFPTHLLLHQFSKLRCSVNKITISRTEKHSKLVVPYLEAWHHSSGVHDWSSHAHDQRRHSYTVEVPPHTQSPCNPVYLKFIHKYSHLISSDASQ